MKETKRFGSLMREPLNIKVNGKSISTPTGQTQTILNMHRMK